MGARLHWLVLVALVSSAFGAQAPQKIISEYDVGPTPDWVRPLELPATDSSPANSEAATDYLLMDRQIRADRGSQMYFRLVVRLNNPAGVEDLSQLTINFDPLRERLRLHSVRLLRDGQVLDELRLGRIDVLHREQNLERSLLDGSKTFHLVMSDVRVGDTLDYSYSLEYRNPEWDNRFFGRYTTNWGTTLKRSRLKIVTKSGTALHWVNRDGTQPARQSDGVWDSLEWNWSDIPALRIDGDVPSWFEQHAVIQASQFESWAEIVRLAEPLYRLEGKPEPELTALVTRLRAAGKTDEERVLAVLRFVQEDVRYTGIELDSGAYRPSPPSKVLQRRYGDCKDKTLLAVALLRDLGIEAAPALVGTIWKEHAGEQLPSPAVFNHVIVRVSLGGRIYWLDATATSEGGSLTRYARGSLGAALVIAPGVTELETIPSETPEDASEVVDTEFDVRQGLDREAVLSVSSTYHGSDADGMRRRLRSTERETLARQYLSYYKRLYPGIRTGAAMKVKDDLLANELQVIEDYRIDNLFEKNDKQGQVFELEAESILAYLRAPDTSARTSPLAVSLPLNVRQHIKVRLPEYFPVKDGTQKIDSPAFHYESSVSHDGNDVFLDYHYWTVADSVAVTDLTGYEKNLADARDDLSFRFSRRMHETNEQQAASALEQLKAAIAFAKNGQDDKADPLLRTLIDSEGYWGLNEAQQHATVYLAGAVAFDREDSQRSLELLRRSTEMAGADQDDWSLRLEAASQNQDYSDAAFSLTTLASRWPKELKTLDDHLVARTVRRTPWAGSGKYRLLKALFDAKYSRPDFDPSGWWRDLALLQLERNEQTDAIKSLSEVRSPYAIISILADSRFISMREKLRDGPNVAAAANRQIERDREGMQRAPNKLEPVNALLRSLLVALRFQEALRVTDDVIARANKLTGKKAYVDYEHQYAWVLDNRSRALRGLGRWDEALSSELAASHREERGKDNVSQVINLAGLYTDLSRPHEARAALSALNSDNISSYGLMQMEIELLASADELGDIAEIQAALEYLQEHRNVSMSTYQRALISANRTDEAAKLLTTRLNDPEQRLEALMEVQQYGDTPSTDRLREIQRRWRAVVQRPDVQDVINKVGNVGSYGVNSEYY